MARSTPAHRRGLERKHSVPVDWHFLLSSDVVVKPLGLRCGRRFRFNKPCRKSLTGTLELTLSCAGRPRGFRAYGSKISFRDSKSLTNSTHLWAGLHALCIRPIVFFSDSVRPSDRTSIRRTLHAIGSEVAATTVARQRFAAMRFERIDPDAGANDLAKHSNHQQGKVGRLVVAALCLAIDTNNEHSP